MPRDPARQKGGSMAHYHCQIHKVKRGGGGAVKKAAYNSGEKLHDSEQQKDFAFDKPEVLDSQILLPKNAPARLKDRAALWNEATKAEKDREKGIIAREFEIAIPNALTEEQAKRLVNNFAKTLARQGMCVDYSIHWKAGNHHAHVLTTTRKIDKNGNFEKAKEKKVYARDENGNKIPLLDENGKQKTRERKGKGVEKLWQRVTVSADPFRNKETYKMWRRRWQNFTNAALKMSGSKDRVSCLSYKDRGIDKIPQIHEGRAAREIEKRGGTSRLCEINREIKKVNDGSKQKNIDSLDKQAAALRAEIALLEKEKKQQQQPEQQKQQKPEQNAQPSKDENITICGWLELSNEERKEVWSSLPPRLQRQPLSVKNKEARSELIENQRLFMQKSVYAKNENGNFVMLCLNKKQAHDCGLIESATKGTFTPVKTQVKSSRIEECINKMPEKLREANRREFSRLNAGGGGGVSKGIQKGIDGMTGALDTEKTSKQHFKAAKDGIKEALATPKKIVGDFISNPITALVKAPFRVAEGAANLASAAANATAGAAKSGTMLSESNGNSGGGASAGPVRVRTREDEDKNNGLDSWKYLSEARRDEKELEQNLKEYHI